MKFFLLFIATVFLFSCNTSTPKEASPYPEEMTKVFEKHGGLENWKKQKTLSFNIGEEVHTSDLYSRKIVINSPEYSLGFNGAKTWLKKEEDFEFKRNPDFYYNLFFYFYAMPFVLADDGITYEKVDDLEFEGIKYSGFKISYNANKGTSPDDNYFLYYNPETYQMEWLGYTVTFKSKVPSDNIKMIRYHSWKATNGLVLPEKITWYVLDENNQPKNATKKSVTFTLPLLSKEGLGDDFFEKPKDSL